MTPKERARELIQDIIIKNTDPEIWEASRLWVAVPLAASLADHLAVIPRTSLPPVKYIESDQAYEHTMGFCHESFGSSAAIDVAAEWVAIAEHMADREVDAQIERDAMALYRVHLRGVGQQQPDGWPDESVRDAWRTAARAVRAVDENAIFPGDADLTGMDS